MFGLLLSLSVYVIQHVVMLSVVHLRTRVVDSL